MSNEVIKLEDLMNRVIGWAVGNAVTQYLDKLGPGELAQVINSQAMKLIQQIREILDDDTLDDEACFRRIDALVTAFYKAGLYTSRH